MNASAPVRLKLDPGLQPEAYRDVFQRYGRLHVPGILTAESAARLNAYVAGAQGWHRAVHVDDGTDYDIPVEEIEELAPEERALLEGGIYEAARHSFRYMFDGIRITHRALAGEAVEPELEAARALVNGPEFLDFVRRLTGDPRPVYADAMATRYLPGHFLTAHDDEADGSHRLYAYVLNLTPRWRADWGGLLLFLDEEDHVEEGYVPAFNALNIFRVPQRHAVSFVTPFADGPRLSLTGWIRAKAPEPGLG